LESQRVYLTQSHNSRGLAELAHTPFEIAAQVEAIADG
jgi:hypothetical protein